jgi:hypothetical protein
MTKAFCENSDRRAERIAENGKEGTSQCGLCDDIER